MNNAAYLRHAELGRVDYFIRTSFWKQLKKKNYGIGFVAVNIRYRRELRLFKAYRIETRPIFWDELQLIMEQRFVDPDTDFLHTLIYCKYVLIKNGKKVKRSIADCMEGDGFHMIDFYEKQGVNGKNEDSMMKQRKFTNNGNYEEEKEDNGDIEDIVSFVNERRQNLNASYHDAFTCRNEIPRSLKIWMQCLEQSSNESRRNLL